MTQNCSLNKIKAVQSQNAELVLLKTRSEVISACLKKEQEGYVYFHPSDNNQIIAGQGTCILEDYLINSRNISAIFASCGGGGLLSGCFLASQKIYPNAKVIGCEPAIANDASLSVRQNKIFSFTTSPNTMADGARTLAVSDRCFFYLKQLSQILEISEEQIIFWQQQLTFYLQQNIEYTSALAMAGCVKFLEQNLPSFDVTNKVTLGFTESGDLSDTNNGVAYYGTTVAINVRSIYSWAANVPIDLFLEYVLPYSSVNEARSDWRPLMLTAVQTMLNNSGLDVDTLTVTDVVSIVNNGLWTAFSGKTITFKSEQTPLIYDPMSVLAFSYAR
jgi:threonine dehydratase